MNVLELKNVSMKFGDLQVLQDLSFSVSEGSIFGFLGKNGAGKTTTMKLILGFLKPTAGDIFVSGEKVTYGDTKKNRFIGYLPDVPSFYGYMNPKEYLRLCGRIAGMDKETIEKKSSELLSLVGLDGVHRRIRGFSRGMKQRLGIAQALLNEPKLLLCDEPTSALDPIGRKEILEILQAVKDRTTVVFSTHILNDVERICDRICLLDHGKIRLEGEMGEVKRSFHKPGVSITFLDEKNVEVYKQKLAALPEVLDVTLENSASITIELVPGANERALLEWVFKENVPLKKFELLEPSLERVFLEVVEK